MSPARSSSSRSSYSSSSSRDRSDRDKRKRDDEDDYRSDKRKREDRRDDDRHRRDRYDDRHVDDNREREKRKREDEDSNSRSSDSRRREERTAEETRTEPKPEEPKEPVVEEKPKEVKNGLIIPTNLPVVAAKPVKPTFISKEEREKLALERRAQQVEEKMKKLEEAKKMREKFFQEAEKEKEKERRDDRRGGGSDRRDRDREREQRRKEREDRDKERKQREKEKEKEKEKEREAKELEMIRAAYLGGKKEKKKLIKPSEKFKFVFDWDEEDDTSRNLNPLFDDKREIKPMFGRGFMAGIDQKEQIKEYKKYLAEIGVNRDDKTLTESQKSAIEKKFRSLVAAENTGPHWSEKTLEEMTERDWRIFKEDYNITTKGGVLPHPIRSWKEAPLRKRILTAIEKAGYKEPTPIQRQAIPVALSGRDVMGIAETGSGKTAAFVIPMLEYILKLPKMTPENENDGPYALILAPTRELALQTEQEVLKFASYCDLRCIALVGGIPIEEQGLQLRKGYEIVVATPGRLNDCIESHYIVLNQCTYVVLDEADRMIDMGFEPQVHSILDAMPSTHLKSENEDEAAKQEGNIGLFRTTIMYSATMPIAVERLARKYLRRPAYIIIGEIGRAVDRIQQRVEWTTQEGKMKKLQEVLQDAEPPIMIFMNKKKMCDGIAKQLEKLGWRATSLHAGRSQMQREAAIEGFKAGKYDILVATDVMGRGIDVKGVTQVINYDMPKTIEDYTHRIGRTGRAGAEGIATSFITNDDTEIMYDIKQMLQSTGNFVPQELAIHPAAQHKPGSVADRPRRETIIYAK